MLHAPAWPEPRPSARLVRVVHHYGQKPDFVVLGGLVPDLLCSGSAWRHAGTTDVDVQVNLEVAAGAVNTAQRLLAEAPPQAGADGGWL